MAEWFRLLDFSAMTRVEKLASVVRVSAWFNSSVIPVNSQLVFFRSVSLKAPLVDWSIK